jgi:arsenical pump membrane protein
VFTASLIFLATLILVIWQPRGLGIGWSAAAGAIAALLAGVIHVGDIPVVWHIVWNATGAFVAVIVISLLLDKAGFFEWAALHVARWGRGSGRRLFVLLVLLGAAVAALFANDGAALILTPIVIAMLAALRFPPRATLAFVMAAGFIADTASLPLVVSNLVNIVSADYFGIGFARYAAVMVPVNLVSVAATLGALVWFFRKDIPAAYDLAQLKRPADAIHDRATFITGWWVLALLLAGFFWLDEAGVPISAVAAGGAALLLAVAARGHPIIGADLGPKITPIGSLATLLWLHVLSVKGIRISWGAYFRTGILLTLPILLATLCALALRLSH